MDYAKEYDRLVVQSNTQQEEIESLRRELAEKDAENRLIMLNLTQCGEQLAASLAREVQLREDLEDARTADDLNYCASGAYFTDVIDKALALPQDTTALDRIKAEYEAQIQQLREATEGLLHLCDIIGMREGPVLDKARHALALPQDTTALEAMIAKAGEVMRERCADKCTDPYYTPDGFGITGADRRCAEEIRALPGVTLEDLK